MSAEAWAGCACHEAPWAQHRVSEGHVAVRFGDAGHRWVVTLNGQDVTDQCLEANADHGYVVLYELNENGKRHRCQNGLDHAAKRMHRGVVTIARLPEQYDGPSDG